MSGLICVYDLETTGLPNKSRLDLPGIIQIAACLYTHDGKEVDVYQTRVNPELPDKDWEQGAIRVTGIGPDQVEKDWPTMFEIFPAFADFVARAKVLSGYNILGFDDDVLYNNLVRYGFEKNFPWPRRRFDVMDVAKREYARNRPANLNHKGKRGNSAPKLTTLHFELFGEELEGAHDALNDVRGTARVGFKIGQEDIARIMG